MKLHLSALSLGVALAYALAFPLHAATEHVHTDSCSHSHEQEADHDHEHEAEGHDHEAEGHDHEHEGTCSGDHDHEHEGHDHGAEGHDHEHEGTCSGDHDHEHEGHDHEAEGHDHSHEGDGHDHAHEASGDHDHEHEGHDHEHEGHDHAHDHEHESSGTCSGGHDHDHAHESGPVIVKVDAHARSILNMQIETVPEAGHALVGSVFGYLSAPDHAVETYSLPCEGRITLHVKSAQAVRKGDSLYTLQSPAIAAALADQRKAQAALTRGERETKVLQERVDTLTEIGSRNSELESQLIFKQAEVDQSRQDLQAADALLHQLTYNGELQEENGVPLLLVRAEKDGTVRNLGLSQGSWGGQGTPVITMSDPKALEVSASLYASAVPAFSDMRATLSTADGQVELKGAWRLAEQVDVERQTRALYFTPDSLPEGARAGQLCRLDLYGGATAKDVVSIPDSAIIKVGVDDVVFLEIGEGQFAMVKVQAGESRRGMTPVKGLVPGQRLVVQGGYELKYILPAQGGAQKKAGHFHADGKFHEGEDH